MITKKFILISITLLFISVTKAGNGNVYLDGENKIILGNASFANEIEWTDFSTFVPLTTLSPLQTDWFTHNGKAHIVIQLTNSKNDRLLLELGRKKTYQFPKELNDVSDEKDYHLNLFELFVKDKNNERRKFGFGNKAHMNVQVIEITPTEVKIHLTGTISYYLHPTNYENGPLSDPITITGNISLRKKEISLPHLKDNYPDCDNSIYDEVSPFWKNTGEWRTATDCERSFYSKIFPLMKKALQPVYEYYQQKGFIFEQDKSSIYQPVELRLKRPENPFFCAQNTVDGRDFYMASTANPLKGPLADLNNKLMQVIGSANGKNVDKEVQQITRERSNYTFQISLYLNRPLDIEGYSSDHVYEEAGNGYARVVNDDEIENGAAKDHTAYFLYGKWQPVNLQQEIVDRFIPSEGAKELSVQSVIIKIYSSKATADHIAALIDKNALKELMKVTP
ncbi:MAG TPA: hypothetical protein VFT78_02840 [Hanamia sp.]|nr:hypothetical protein [Hanamia sp.]